MYYIKARPAFKVHFTISFDWQLKTGLTVRHVPFVVMIIRRSIDQLHVGGFRQIFIYATCKRHRSVVFPVQVNGNFPGENIWATRWIIAKGQKGKHQQNVTFVKIAKTEAQHTKDPIYMVLNYWENCNMAFIQSYNDVKTITCKVYIILYGWYEVKGLTWCVKSCLLFTLPVCLPAA